MKSAVIIGFMDYSFSSKLNEIINRYGYNSEDYDLVLIPKESQNFKFLREGLTKSIKFSNPKNIILLLYNYGYLNKLYDMVLDIVGNRKSIYIENLKKDT